MLIFVAIVLSILTVVFIVMAIDSRADVVQYVIFLTVTAILLGATIAYLTKEDYRSEVQHIIHSQHINGQRQIFTSSWIDIEGKPHTVATARRNDELPEDFAARHLSNIRRGGDVR